MNPISIRVSDTNHIFIEKMCGRGVNKTDLVNKALDLFRKAQLKKELTQMARENFEEDAKMAEKGMEDYLTLIQDAF